MSEEGAAAAAAGGYHGGGDGHDAAAGGGGAAPSLEPTREQLLRAVEAIEEEVERLQNPPQLPVEDTSDDEGLCYGSDAPPDSEDELEEDITVLAAVAEVAGQSVVVHGTVVHPFCIIPNTCYCLTLNDVVASSLIL
jgi:hypothetical protein